MAIEKVNLPMSAAIAAPETGKVTSAWSRAFSALGTALRQLADRADGVAGIVPVASPDATVAGAGYNQAQAQSVVTLANELKSKLNALIAAANL